MQRQALIGIHSCLWWSATAEKGTPSVTGNSSALCPHHVLGDGLALQFFFGGKRKDLANWHLPCT